MVTGQNNNPLDNTNRYKQLSAIFDADSFFYGMFDDTELLSSKVIQFDQLPKIESNVSKKIAVRNAYFSLLPNMAYDQKVKLKVLQSIPGFLHLKNPVVLENAINDTTISVWGMEKSTFTTVKELNNVNAMMHFSAAFIQACLSKKRDGVFLHVLGTHIDVAVIVNGKLEVYNLLTYQKKEDLLYYALLYKSKASNENIPVFLSGAFNKLQQDFIKNYIDKVEAFTLDFSIPSIFQSKEFYTGIEAVQQCV